MDKVQHRTWVRVAKLYSHAFRSLSERLTPIGLSVAQYDLLAALVASEPQRLKQSELAAKLLVTKGNISGMLRRMAQLGLVERSGDPLDRRSKRIIITDQGRELFERGQEVQGVLIAEMFDGIEPEQMRIFEEVVSYLCEKMEHRGFDEKGRCIG